MSSTKFLFQGLADHPHDAHLIDLLSLANITDFLAGVAFVKQSGVQRISSELKAVGGRAAFFVGIRNEITSYQGVLALLSAGASVWAVDTASRRRVYHPKIYLSSSASKALAVIGSANLTAGGLGFNVEASAKLIFDLTKPEDLQTVISVKQLFDALPTQHPRHVFKIENEKAASKLLDEGRLVDESQPIVSAPTGVQVKDRSDDLVPMNLSIHSPEHITTNGQRTVIQRPNHSPKMTGFRLVWLSKQLTERDLNIPTGAKTNPTGSMGLKLGDWHEDIDHRHYFRDTVFSACHWEVDPGNARWERASIIADLKVKGIWHGHYAFRLSHNRDTKSRTYEQKNFMTQLSWGDAKPLIARSDLLGRHLSLYRDDTTSERPQYLIEID